MGWRGAIRLFGGEGALKRFVRDQLGGIAVPLALTMIVLLGFASLGAEMAYLFFTGRHMQSAADASALAAVTARTTGYPRDFAAEARAVTGFYGVTHGSDGVTVTVNSPPSSGPHMTDGSAVEVLITQPKTLVLASLFHPEPFLVRARAVAVSAGAGGYCVLILDPTAQGAATGSGGVVANLVNCGMAVNSSNASAINLSGGAALNASQINIVGGYHLSGGATIHATEPIVTSGQPISDPYAGVGIPVFSGCDHNNYSASGGTVATLSPGVYCNGIRISGGSAITLQPGVYIMDRGGLSVSGQSTLSGTGVTIVLTSSTASSWGSVSISGGTAVNIIAPTSGATAGIAFFQDRRAGGAANASFSGGSGQTIVGALYFPTQAVSYSGGTSTGSTCSEIIANTLKISGNMQLKLDCTGMPVAPIGGKTPRLVE